MSFIKSILFGNEGIYHFCGIRIEFSESKHHIFWQTMGNHPLHNFTKHCLRNRWFCILTQGYLHALIHELCHAIPSKILTKGKVEVTVFTNSCSGNTVHDATTSGNLAIIGAAGPIGHMTLSASKLVAIAALREYLGTPLTLSVAAGDFLWMSGELLYGYFSAVSKKGDLGWIATHNKNYFNIASTLLVSIFAAGVFGAVEVGKYDRIL